MNPTIIDVPGYSNITREDLPNHALCLPYNTKERAMEAFNKFTPDHFLIDNVPYFADTKTKCEWHVDYQLRNKTKIVDWEQVTELSLNIKAPHNVLIKDIRLNEYGMITILYIIASCSC